MKHKYRIKKSSVHIFFLLAFVTGLSVSYIPTNANAADLQPSYRYTQTPVVDNSSSVIGYGITTDSTGAVYSVGAFNGTVNFAGSTGNDSITSNAGTAYITKHNSNGSYEWTRTVENNGGYAQATGVATDNSGDVYIVGAFSGDVTFDGPGGTHTGSIQGGATFLSKYSSDGTYQWTKTIIPGNNGQASASSLALDANGNIFLYGSFQGTVNFAATNGGADNQTDAGGSGDAFVTRFNADGSYGWTKIFNTSNGSAQAAQAGIAINASGAIIITGAYYGSISIDGATETDNSGNGSVFVAQLTPSGSESWIHSIENNSNTYISIYSLATDLNGNIYITGGFQGDPNFAGVGGNDVQTDAGGSGDAFLSKYGANGTYQWTKSFDTSQGGYAGGDSVTTDSLGDVYLLSGFSNSVNFEGSTGNDSKTESNSGAITMYSASGAYRWTKVFDTTNGSAVETQGVAGGITADTLGNIYATSVFSGTVGFDGPGGSDTQTAGGYGSDFLTSYATFDPNSAVSNPSQNTTATTPTVTTVTAPDTGYVASIQNYSAVIVTLLIAAGALTGFVLLIVHIQKRYIR